MGEPKKIDDLARQNGKNFKGLEDRNEDYP